MVDRVGTVDFGGALPGCVTTVVVSSCKAVSSGRRFGYSSSFPGGCLGVVDEGQGLDGDGCRVICGWGRGWQRMFCGFVLCVSDFSWLQGGRRGGDRGDCGGEVLSVEGEVEECVAVLVVEGVLVAVEEFRTILVVASGWKGGSSFSFWA